MDINDILSSMMTGMSKDFRVAYLPLIAHRFLDKVDPEKTADELRLPIRTVKSVYLELSKRVNPDKFTSSVDTLIRGVYDEITKMEGVLKYSLENLVCSVVKDSDEQTPRSLMCYDSFVILKLDNRHFAVSNGKKGTGPLGIYGMGNRNSANNNDLLAIKLANMDNVEGQFKEAIHNTTELKKSLLIGNKNGSLVTYDKNIKDKLGSTLNTYFLKRKGRTNYNQDFVPLLKEAVVKILKAYQENS